VNFDIIIASFCLCQKVELMVLGDKNGFHKSSHNYICSVSNREIIFCVVIQCDVLSSVYSQIFESILC